MVPNVVKEWCIQNGYGTISAIYSVGGGCINKGARIETSSGKFLFLKTNSCTPKNMFCREAEGLKEISIDDGLRVPVVHLFGEDFILLEDIPSTPRCASYWQVFGHRLAALHNHTCEQFGFDHDNYIGSTPQLNPWTENGYNFFGEYRLMFQARLAHKQGLLEKRDIQSVDSITVRLTSYIPVQPASLIHGDLWSGNAISGPNGLPVLIDPAAYYGWAEAELGMTALFGGFPEEFYRAYQEVRPLSAGWRERFSLYNLYHLLNHLNLFGSGYYGQVRSILNRYS